MARLHLVGPGIDLFSRPSKEHSGWRYRYRDRCAGAQLRGANCVSFLAALAASGKSFSFSALVSPPAKFRLVQIRYFFQMLSVGKAFAVSSLPHAYNTGSSNVIVRCSCRRGALVGGGERVLNLKGLRTTALRAGLLFGS